MTTTDSYDVAIVGGGPAGTTCGTLLKKYRPELRVAILEKEKFPREHVGESQLPACGFYLREMGCWEKVEAADFPIKVGATYRWGKSDKLWDFEFLPLHQVPEGPRPHAFEGPRSLTAFQVERAIYDEILLRHAEEMGCEVFEETKVQEVHKQGDAITGLTLHDGRRVEARHYVDATGHVGLIRRAMDVKVEVPTKLKNVAMWDYWENAEWAVEIGVGGTRVQVLSVDNGWVWFIPLGPTRTSIGFICPAEVYKKSGKTKEELYAEALKKEPRVQALIRNATSEGEVRATKDWSFVAERIFGDNWYVIGEAAGFADPILAGGLTLAHDCARQLAYSILAIERGEHDREWLLRCFQDNQTNRVRQYIRFADFWYASNGQFTDLQDITKDIAKGAGLKLTPQAAFRWLSLGGFNLAESGRPGLGGLDLGAVKEVTGIFTDTAKVSWEINKYNTYTLDLQGAVEDEFPILHEGAIERRRCWRRDGHTLPYGGVHGFVIECVKQFSNIQDIVRFLQECIRKGARFSIHDALATIETMVVDGWLLGKMMKNQPSMRYEPPRGTDDWGFHDNRDEIPGLEVR